MLTIQYADHSDSQVMDLYIYETDGKKPLIVLIHGGAFMFGDQKMPLIRPVIKHALNAGYAVASLDYRKSKEARFPASLADVKAAVRYLKAHAYEYGIDPERITLWGESAGGYLALMTALTPCVKELDGDIDIYQEHSSAVSSIAVFYPPVEFYTMKAEYQSWGDREHGSGMPESRYIGIPDIYEDKAACDQTYWETYRDHLPADFRLSAFVQTGDENDDKVPYTQAVNFAERLAKLENTDVCFEQKRGAGHMDPAFYTDENINRIIQWLNEKQEA